MAVLCLAAIIQSLEKMLQKKYMQEFLMEDFGERHIDLNFVLLLLTKDKVVNLQKFNFMVKFMGSLKILKKLKLDF